MRRLIIFITAISLIGFLIIVAANSGAGRAQIAPPPTPKGQLGGAPRLTTPPVSLPPFATSTPATNAIVGSWLVTEPQQSAAAPVLLTFAADGTLSGAAGNARGSSLHGEWSVVGSGGIALRAVWLTFDANGAYTGVVELTGSLSVNADGNTWDGQIAERVLGPNGVVKAVTGPVAVHGTRITVQAGALFPVGTATPVS